MMADTGILAAFGIGLAGAGHCLGMCGGIAAAINLGGNGGRATTLAYHGGRLCSYAALGALLGGLAGSINLAQWTMFLRYLAALLLIAMGLSIADWWRGISVLERVGARKSGRRCRNCRRDCCRCGTGARATSSGCAGV
jgi:sulfite exporter TauE/SafE